MHFRVVVSDQSDDEPSYATEPAQTMARVRLRGQDVTFTRHLPRRGLAEHRQFLLDQAGSPYVLFLDDDVWLEPAALARLRTAIGELGCGFVGAAVQGLSYVDDERPHQLASFEEWDGPVTPETITRDSPEFWRATTNAAANPYHLERKLGLKPGGWLGGELVERLGISVEEGAHPDAPSSLGNRPVTASATVPAER